MTVLRRRVLTLFGLAVAFGGGLAVGRESNVRGHAQADVGMPDRASETAAAAPACTDRLAMEANANLVGQLHDYRRRLVSAEERAKGAERERTRAAESPPSRLVTSRAEWARMAREGRIHVRLPCSNIDQSGSLTVRRAGSIGIGTSFRSGETQRRAELLGLSRPEIQALADAYKRAHARTWAAMRPTCDANERFRTAVWAHDEDHPPTDLQLIERCRNVVLDLDLDDASAGAALTRVAELHAAGAGIGRATSDEQRAIFALTNAPAMLFEEMVGVLGREKAVRAIDGGLVCLDETVFDLRDGSDETG